MKLNRFKPNTKETQEIPFKYQINLQYRVVSDGGGNGILVDAHIKITTFGDHIPYYVVDSNSINIQLTNDDEFNQVVLYGLPATVTKFEYIKLISK